jgi:hypothetical protein
MTRNFSNYLRLAIFTTISMVGVLFLTGLAGAQGIESVLAPGKLIQGHAKWDDDCKACHVKFDRTAQSGLCADCHKEVGADMRAKTGYHGRLKPQACNTCHMEHRGRNAQMVNFDKNKFDHGQSDFMLRDKHLPLACEKCHVTGKKYREASTQCSVCHRKDDVHKGALGAKCADCHTENSWKDFKFDHGTTRFALTDKHVSVKCVACHKAGSSYKDAPRACVGCHRKDDDGAKGHKGLFGEKCETCHAVHLWKTVKFNHDTDTKYALRGKHVTTACTTCHTGNLYRVKLSHECNACHAKDDKHKQSLGKDCASCHTERNWKEPARKFDHDQSRFRLLGKHIKIECKECHKSVMFKETPSDCLACHKKDDKHKGTLGEKCAECHGEKEWKDTQGRFSHDKTKFVLRNAHAKAPVKCDACHKDLSSFRKTPMECFSCHQKDDKHEGQEGRSCEKCHTDRDWKAPQFDHGLTRFPLLGKHGPLACDKCHTGAKFKDAKTTCVACHAKDDKHKKALGSECGQCHNARTWKDWKFDHDRLTKFVLDGKHKTTACGLCHTRPTESRLVATSSECYSCHAKEDVHQAGFGRRCQLCHVTSSFKTLKQKAIAPDGKTVSTPSLLQEQSPARPSPLLPRSAP